jgi:hypothetical protein
VVDLNPAIEQHQLQIAVADREHQVPPHRPQDHLGGELPSLEIHASTHCCRTPSDPASIIPHPGQPQKRCNRALIVDAPPPLTGKPPKDIKTISVPTELILKDLPAIKEKWKTMFGE